MVLQTMMMNIKNNPLKKVGFLFGILKYCYTFALTNQLNYYIMKLEFEKN